MRKAPNHQHTLEEMCSDSPNLIQEGQFRLPVSSKCHAEQVKTICDSAQHELTLSRRPLANVPLLIWTVPSEPPLGVPSEVLDRFQDVEGSAQDLGRTSAPPSGTFNGLVPLKFEVILPPRTAIDISHHHSCKLPLK